MKSQERRYVVQGYATEKTRQDNGTLSYFVKGERIMSYAAIMFIGVSLKPFEKALCFVSNISQV